MVLTTNGKITRILEHKVIEGISTTKIAIDQDHLGIRCVRLQTEIGDESLGKHINVRESYDPSGNPTSQGIMLDGNYKKINYN